MITRKNILHKRKNLFLNNPNKINNLINNIKKRKKIFMNYYNKCLITNKTKINNNNFQKVKYRQIGKKNRLASQLI